MAFLRKYSSANDLKEKEDFTLNLLHPKQESTIAERTHDALKEGLE